MLACNRNGNPSSSSVGEFYKEHVQILEILESTNTGSVVGIGVGAHVHEFLCMTFSLWTNKRYWFNVYLTQSWIWRMDCEIWNFKVFVVSGISWNYQILPTSEKLQKMKRWFEKASYFYILATFDWTNTRRGIWMGTGFGRMLVYNREYIDFRIYIWM